jgi:magnesium transporter
MLTIYGIVDGHLTTSMFPGSPPPDCEPVWFDLLEPTPEEDRDAEQLIGLSLPTRDEMQEIEASSRLYVEDGALFMTALVPVLSETDRPYATAITFIMSGHRLATVRYDRPRSFDLYRLRAERPGTDLVDGRSVLIGLLETVIDRLADGLERIGADIERLSAEVFRSRPTRERKLEEALTTLARLGNSVARNEDCIVSLSRLFNFLGEENGSSRLDRDGHARLVTLGRDARSLAEYAKSLSSKLDFLLTATLGLVAVEQNTIVKIFSILAVVFMPPTLIASIYGMNFHTMPELDWVFGYPMALGLMLASVAATFALFKWRHWL